MSTYQSIVLLIPLLALFGLFVYIAIVMPFMEMCRLDKESDRRRKDEEGEQ